MSENALVNRLISPQVFARLSPRWVQQKIREGKVYHMDNGDFLVDESGEYRKQLLQSSKPKANQNE